jgi:hypothetical protein
MSGLFFCKENDPSFGPGPYADTMLEPASPVFGSAAGYLLCGGGSTRSAPIRSQLRKRRDFWDGTNKRHCAATDRARRRGLVLVIHVVIVKVWRSEALLRLNYPCATMIAKLIRATVEPATTIMRKTFCVHIADSPTIWLLGQSIKGTGRPRCNVKLRYTLSTKVKHPAALRRPGFFIGGRITRERMQQPQK